MNFIGTSQCVRLALHAHDISRLARWAFEVAPEHARAVEGVDIASLENCPSSSRTCNLQYAHDSTGMSCYRNPFGLGLASRCATPVARPCRASAAPARSA